MAIEAPLKYKHRAPRPKGQFRADYAGNSGKHRARGRPGPVAGTGRTRTKTLVPRKGRLPGSQDPRPAQPLRPAAGHRGTTGAGMRSVHDGPLQLRSPGSPSRDQQGRKPHVVQLDGPDGTLPMRKVFTHHGYDPPVILEILTAREQDVLVLAGELYSTAEIAAELLITVNTVKTHLRTAYRKLGVGNRRDAVRRGRATGLLPDPLWTACPACHGTGRIILQPGLVP